MKVLITGASSGIGRDIAREFAKKNCNLILVARREDKLMELKNNLENEYGVKAQYYLADLSNKDKCVEVFERFKDIDILINNAGLGDFGFFSETKLDKDLNIINTNIMGLHILTKLYLKNMKEKNAGKILNVASIAGFMPGPLMATYYASKNYVVKLSEAIKEELKKEKSKVQISILCPGPVKTNFNNIANVNFEISSLSSEYVARYTVKRFLKGKFYIVPGFHIRLIKLFSKIVPTSLLASIVYNSQKRKDRK